MTERAGTLRLDVWGGLDSMDHVARLHFAPGDADWIERVRAELTGGFLVNMRILGRGEGWGPDRDFDKRSAAAGGTA